MHASNMASSERVHRALEAAADLTRDEREELVAELILRLEMEAEPDADWEEAWTAEIKRRVDDALSGKSATRPWSEVRDEIRRQLRRPA